MIYSGDDERFDYVYRFVTRQRVDLVNRAANRDILDDGTLSVARYNADGSSDWLPLVHGQGPLTQANGFASQADVLIETRRAADLLGATKMDRPEDVEANRKTNKVYVAADQQQPAQARGRHAANPRADNRFGHIIEMIAAGRRPCSGQVQMGNSGEMRRSFSRRRRRQLSPPKPRRNGWFGMPDNVALDAEGRLMGCNRRQLR